MEVVGLGWPPSWLDVQDCHGSSEESREGEERGEKERKRREDRGEREKRKRRERGIIPCTYSSTHFTQQLKEKSTYLPVLTVFHPYTHLYLKEGVSSVELKHDAANAPQVTRVAPTQFCEDER